MSTRLAMRASFRSMSNSVPTAAAARRDLNGPGTTDAAGIRVTGLGNRIDGNNLTLNALGLDVSGVANLIVRNRATLNGNGAEDDYVIVDGDRAVTIGVNPQTARPWGSFLCNTARMKTSPSRPSAHTKKPVGAKPRPSRRPTETGLPQGGWAKH